MTALVSAEELVLTVRKSGVVDGDRLAGYLDRRRAGPGLPADPAELADEMVRDGLVTGFQAEQFLMGKWKGFTLGKFALLERVGVGGMGTVFLAEHRQLGKRVALKVLPPAKAASPAALGRFYREARAAAGLHHPNIVRTHDIGQEDDLHYLVMDYIAGPNLLDVVRRGGPLPVGRAVSYARQVAAGLDYAFRAGLVHRDVKPGNILIDAKGVAHLLDLGLARFFQDQADQLTMKYDGNVVLGTADYVAPEQIANSHTADTRADIYALGGTLYFLLAGHPPFPTGSVAQKLGWHQRMDPTPIREVRPEVPDGLAAVLAKMMAKSPADRYQTPVQAAEALAEWEPAEVGLPPAAEMPQLSPAASAVTARPAARFVPVAAVRPAAAETATAAPQVTPPPPAAAEPPAPKRHRLPVGPVLVGAGLLAAGTAVVVRYWL